MTTVATPDTRNRMNSTLVMRPDQPARADAMDALLRPSRRGDSLHAPEACSGIEKSLWDVATMACAEAVGKMGTP